jgi:hypothetical protein
VKRATLARLLAQRPRTPATLAEPEPEPEPPWPRPRPRIVAKGDRAPRPLDELELAHVNDDDEPLGYMLGDDPEPERAAGGWTGARVDSREPRPLCARCGGTGVNIGTYSNAPLWRPCHVCGHLGGRGIAH